VKPAEPGALIEAQVLVEAAAADPAAVAAVAAALSNARRALGAAEAGLTVVLTGDEALQALNRAYRGQDKPTDVLSFPAEDAAEPGEAPYLGDVLISVPAAGRSADAAGHPLHEELALLAVHGLLHLLGHEDDSEAGAAGMLRLELALGVRRPDDLPEDVPEVLPGGRPAGFPGAA
jgi:probable rRNA maturation factor